MKKTLQFGMTFNRNTIKFLALIVFCGVLLGQLKAQYDYEGCEGEKYDGVNRLTTTGTYDIYGETVSVKVYKHDTAWRANDSTGKSNTINGCESPGISWGGRTYSEGGTHLAITSGYVSSETHPSDFSPTGNCSTNHWVKVNVEITANPLVFDSVDTCMRYNTSVYHWHGFNFNTELNRSTQLSKFYMRPTGAGCDEKVVLRLSKHAYDSIPLEKDTVCDNFDWNGYHFTTSQPLFQFDSADGQGTSYSGWKSASFKCPRIYSLNLTLFDTKSRDTAVTACDTFRWNRISPTTFWVNSCIETRKREDAGIRWVVYDSIRNSEGFVCHDTIWLGPINILHSTESTDSVAACRQYKWINDNTYTFDNGAVQTDIYTIRGVNPSNPNRIPFSMGAGKGNAVGCDSIVNLRLMVYDVDTVIDSVQACQSYTWIDGIDYTSDRDTIDHVKYSEGEIYPGTGIRKAKSYNDIALFGQNYHANNGGDYREGYFHCDSLHYLYLRLDNNSTNLTPNYYECCDSFSFISYNKALSEGRYHIHNGGDFQIDSSLIEETKLYNDTAEQGDTTILIHYPTARLGCDSAVTLNLTIHRRYTDTTNTTALRHPSFPSEIDSICGSWTWTDAENDTILRASGIHYYTNHRSLTGCDSVISIYLHLYPTADSIRHFEPVCFRYVVQAGYDTTYVDRIDTNRVVPGIAANGCDSIYMHYYHVWQHHDSIIDTTVCDSFYWYNATFTALDSNYTTSTNRTRPASPATRDIHGCDSTITLNLVVKHRTYDTLADTISCSPFIWNVMPLRQYAIADRQQAEGLDTAYYTLPAISNLVGCDSIHVLPIHLYQTYNTRDTVDVCDVYHDSLSSSYTRTILHDTTTDWFMRTINGRPVNRQWTGGSGYGCDSNIKVTVYVHHADTNSFIDTALCGYFTWLKRDFERDTLINERHFVDYNGDTLRTINGCDSASRLNLAITPNGVDHIFDTVCDSYVWNANHRTYSAVSDTMDSVVTRGLASTGCDTITVLHLHFRHTVYLDIYDTACDQYTWYGQRFNRSTEAEKNHVESASNGCDSIERLHLVINRSSSSTENHLGDFCDTLRWHSRIFTSDTLGVVDTLTNAVGCDSLVTLNLTLRYSKYVEFDTTACDSITWDKNGRTYQHDTRNVPIKNRPKASIGLASNGCDSVQTLSLTLNHSHIDFADAGIVRVTACDQYVWPLNDRLYTVSNSSKHDNYRCDTLHTVNGCDSAVYLYLTINHRTQDTTTLPNDTSCGQFTWYDTTVYQGWNNTAASHTLYHAVPNIMGCDSVLKISVSVSANRYADTVVRGRRLLPNSTYAASVCDSIIWRGNTYTTSGLYFDSVPLPAGCDSIYSLDVVIGYTTDTIQSRFQCNGTYSWFGNNYSHSTDSATYTYPTKNAQGCDSVARLHLDISSDNYYIDSVRACDNYTWPATGQYFTTSQTDSTVVARLTSSRGCDSVVHLCLLIIKNNIQTDTVHACDSYNWPYDGKNYNISTDTTYQLTEKTIDGCDSARRLLLTLNYSSHIDDSAHGCESYVWTLHTGETKVSRIARNGHNDANWRDYMPNGNIFGCDSTTYLILTIDSNMRGYDNREFCNTLTWNNYTINNNVVGSFYKDASGQYIDNGSYYDTVYGVTANGCDSIYALIATTRGSYMGIDTVRACDHYMWKNYTTYFNSTTTPTRTVPRAAANNCDSIYTLNLTIVRSTHNIYTVRACDQYVWHSIRRISDGIYTFDYIDSITACPSVDTLKLSLLHSSSVNLNMGERCNYFTWEDSTYRVSTTDRRVYTAANGCDSILNMSVTIKQSDYDDDEFISDCDSALFLGKYYYRDTLIESTMVGYNTQGCPNMHRTYIMVFPSYDSTATLTVCDSITWAENGIFYDNSISGVSKHYFSISGCDSVINLDLTVNYGTYDTLQTITQCDGYRWNDSTYTNSTTARRVVGITANLCDSALLQPIIIKHSSVRDTAIVACDKYVWTGTGRTFTNSEISLQRLGDNAIGCDSNIRLDITINRHTESALDTAACDSIFWHYKWFTAGGLYPDTLHNAASNGCDSIVYLGLTIHRSYTNLNYANIVDCDFYTWPIDGATYRVNTDKTVHLGTDAHGCDSTVVLHLILNHSVTNNIYQFYCDSFAWAGTVYHTSDTYQKTFTAANHCDSIVNMRLVLGKTSYNRINASSCDYYTWFGNRYTTSGTYTHRYPSDVRNMSGCDSIAILVLNMSYNDTVIHDTTACNSLRWFGTTYQWSQRGIVNTYANAAGCITYDILNLNMGYSITYDAPAQTVCDSLVWHGTTYTNSGRYIFDTLTTLDCDSTIRFSLTVRPSYKAIDNAGAQCGSYNWYGTTYTESNNTDTRHSPTQGPNGCDTIFTLNLTIAPQGPYYDTLEVCNAYIYQGNTITNDTTLRIDATSVYGCDSTTIRNITIVHSFSETIDTTVCDSLIWMGQKYTTSGHYSRVFPSHLPDCDSTLTLNFTLRGRSSNTVESLTDCPGYRWHGLVLVETIDTTLNFGSTMTGCDSTATIHFVSTETARYSDTIHRNCDRFVWNGQTFTSDTVVLAKFNMASGCDSLSLLHIYVRPTPTHTDEITACDSITWRNGITYRGSTFSPTFSKDWGGLCDSVYTLHLTIKRSIALSSTKAAKDYYQWDDTVLLNSGVYKRTFTAANGCDSTVTLRLTITDVPIPTLVCNDNKLIMVNHYPYGLNFDRVDYVAYRWYRNGTLIPNANLDYYSEYGYTLLNGCYYVEVAIDAERTAWLPSEPFCIGTYGIDDIESSSFEVSVMPNPVTSGAAFTVRANSNTSVATLDLFDLQGRRVRTDTFSGTEQTYNMPLSAGIYTLRLTTASGEATTKKLIVR